MPIIMELSDQSIRDRDVEMLDLWFFRLESIVGDFKLKVKWKNKIR